MSPFTVRLAILGAMAVLCSTGQAWADSAYPTVDLLSTDQTVVGEAIKYPSTGPAQVTSSIVTVAPNSETALHRHGVPMFAYILEGTLTVDYGEKGKRTYKQGDSLVEAMAVTHRGINSNAAPVKILTVYMGAKGSKNVILEAK